MKGEKYRCCPKDYLLHGYYFYLTTLVSRRLGRQLLSTTYFRLNFIFFSPRTVFTPTTYMPFGILLIAGAAMLKILTTEENKPEALETLGPTEKNL